MNLVRHHKQTLFALLCIGGALFFCTYAILIMSLTSVITEKYGVFMTS